MGGDPSPAFRRVRARALVVIVLACWGCAPAAAFAQIQDLARATLDELMNIRVTSASRREQPAEDVPAAVYVLTQDDIRRSGITSLPELFRLVPGMQVARVNANRWAVGVRGFNDYYSNKLLVLVDGRSVYNRAFSGVNWDGQDILLSDIERIEVIRGPGGATWGANAVNGIVNIITRSAADTPGTTVEASLGSWDRNRVSAKHGGALGTSAYRAYAQWSDVGGSTLGTESAGDRWSSLVGGLRLDWKRGKDEVMTQSKLQTSTTRPMWFQLQSVAPGVPRSTAGQSDISEVTVQGRWTRRTGATSVFTAQGFHSGVYRSESMLWTRERTTDGEAQFETRVHPAHGLVVGGGVRQAVFSARRPSLTLAIGDDSNAVVNAFAQDEIRLASSVSLTLGSKIERDTTAGWGLLPSARVLWRPSYGQRLWAGISKARRTPSTTDRKLRVNYQAFPGEFLPVLTGYVGNPDFESEELIESEAGYRTRIGSTAEIDVAVFRGHYDRLMTSEPLTPEFEATPAPAHLFVPFRLGNLMDADTHGVEISGHWTPIRGWRLDGSYSALHLTTRLDPTSRDPFGPERDGNAPAHQWQLRSTTWLTPRVELGGGLYYVGRLRQLGVPSYTRADARAAFSINRRVTAIAVGQNLFDRAHREFNADTLVSTEVPRSVRVDVRWQF